MKSILLTLLAEIVEDDQRDQLTIVKVISKMAETSYRIAVSNDEVIQFTSLISELKQILR